MLLFLCLLAQADPHLEAVEKGVAFPDKDAVAKAAAKSAWHKKALDIVLDPKLWASSLKSIEERTGLKAETLEIKITLAEIKIDNAPAAGHGRAGRGAVTLDVDKLAKNHRGADEISRLKAKGVTVVVPPAKTELAIPHELTHCFQGVDQPGWFLEGMACFVARDPNLVMAYKAAGRKTEAIDAEIPLEWSYARGWAFFEWMAAKHDVKKFCKLTIDDKKPAADAAAEVTGLSWDAAKKAEREWSASWIKAYK
jgi:hypothetical protein